MGFTNVRYPSELLRNAGRESTIPAVFPEIGKFVNIVGHYFEQEELDTYSDVLRHPQKDVWLRHEGAQLQAGRADDAIEKPFVRTSTGLGDPAYKAVRTLSKESHDAAPKPALAYVLIIQGRSGALCNKVRILYTRNAAAGAIFDEAVNGYSTVFSAAILRARVGDLRAPATECNFEKVDSFEDLYASAEKDKGIAFLCGGRRLV